MVTSCLIFLILSGIATGASWLCYYKALQDGLASIVVPIDKLSILVTVLFAYIFLKEKLTLTKVLSVICAMIGLVLIVRTGQSSSNINLTQGIINAFAAACLYASVIILNKFIKNVDDYTKTFIQLFMASMVLLPWVIYRNNIIFDSPKSIILIAILGIAHTGIAYCLYFSAMKELKAQSIAILGYLDPVSSVVFSIFLLKEPFSIYQLIGGVIILASAVIAEKNPKPKTIENGEINL